MFVEDAYDAEPVEDIQIPPKFRQAVARAATVRQAAEQSRVKAADATVKTARQLEKLGLSLRDAAELLGVSHQRVQQLLRSA